MSEFVCSDGTCLPIAVRVSVKAKNQRLTLDHTGKLEVVIPTWMAKRKLRRPDTSDAKQEMLLAEAAVFIEQHRGWIERAAKRTSAQREAYAQSLNSGLPTHLDFAAIGELWLIEYKPSEARSVTVKADGLRRYDGARKVFALKISGNIGDEELCRKALVRFVARYAKEVLPIFAQNICDEIGAKPRSVTVNNRKSAWGVCTQAKDIRIDRKVMFFPADLARQVVLHEAAHLKHLNHSKRFYEELFSYAGSTAEAERAVKKGIQLIPAWFLDG